ncbi:WD40 repeat domain-containing protein [Planctomicrobium sp. SH527]|uniref:WD40 repeat domain-containing protein n=1 Tax=Planctomicrobium sp. SH527 TaxID=3448123 RepID=UPI003F5C288D
MAIWPAQPVSLKIPVFLLFILGVLAAIPLTSFADSGEYIDAMEQDAGEQTDLVVNHLTNQKYAELEALAAQYRKENSKTALGVLRLNLFYRILTSPVTEPGKYTIHAVDDRVQHIEAWYKASPTMTSKIALAGSLYELSAVARGGGYADTVTDNNWRIMKAALERSQRLLDEVFEDEEVPDTFSHETSLRIGIYEHYPRKKMEHHLAEVLKREPVNATAIENVVIYLLPQWHGEDGDIAQFASDLAAQQKHVTGEFAYAAVVNEAYWFRIFTRFEESDFDWERVRQGHVDWLKHAPDSAQVLGRQAFYARVAGDRETARHAFEQLQGRYVPARWSNNPLFYDQSIRWAFDSEEPGESELVIDLASQLPRSMAYDHRSKSVIPTIPGTEVRSFSIETGKQLTVDQTDRNWMHRSFSDPSGKAQFVALNRPEGGVNIIRMNRSAGKADLIGGSDFKFTRFAVSSSLKLIAVNDEDDKLRFWILNPSAVPHSIQTGLGGIIEGLAISPDDKWIATGFDETIKIWDVKTRKLVQTCQSEKRELWGLRWSPDGKMLAAFGDSSQIEIWNPESGALITKLSDGTNWYRTAAFSHDSRYLVLGTYESRFKNHPGDVVIFDVEEKKLIKRYQGHRLTLRDIIVTPDNKKIISSSADGSIRVWKMPVP